MLINGQSESQDENSRDKTLAPERAPTQGDNFDPEPTRDMVIVEPETSRLQNDGSVMTNSLKYKNSMPAKQYDKEPSRDLQHSSVADSLVSMPFENGRLSLNQTATHSMV